jgi:hypothetical protein
MTRCIFCKKPANNCFDLKLFPSNSKIIILKHYAFICEKCIFLCISVMPLCKSIQKDTSCELEIKELLGKNSVTHGKNLVNGCNNVSCFKKATLMDSSGYQFCEECFYIPKRIYSSSSKYSDIIIL